MCGIFGFYNYHGSVALKQIVEKTSLALNHRGPDDFGWMINSSSGIIKNKNSSPDVSSNLLMLHYRLSILDLSDLAWQPMTCDNNQFHIVFNGEIYNYRELRSELMTYGHSFISNSDTEVLLKAYVQWGKECLQKLLGMFAFAIFDANKSSLFLARDVFGIKPLYYTNQQNQFVFASEIKAISQLPIAKNINVQRAYYYLRYGLTDFENETMLTDIFQLPAAHYLEINLNQPHKLIPQRYYSIQSEKNTAITYVEATEKLRTLFLDSIQLHLRSDVLVGAALSGGIDSSSIVMAMRHLNPQLDLHTFSYIADSDEINEEKWIDIVSTKANAISHKIAFDQHELVTDLQALISLHDEPFGSTSIYAQHRVFKLAQQQAIKVMLDGQGADELLAGYSFYRSARFASLIKSRNYIQAFAYLWNTKEYGFSQIALQSLQYLLPPRMQSLLRPIMGKDYLPSWMNKTWFIKNNFSSQPLKTHYSRAVLHEELLHTLATSSLPMLLRYEDRNSMYYSIESRVPFLTPQFAQFIFSLPEHFLIDNNGRSKAIFRDAMRGLVPDAILNRKDKIGFATPEFKWLRILQPWVEKILQSDYAKQLPVFNHGNLINEWQLLLQNKSKFDFRFWRWINFIKWTEQNDISFTS